MSSRALNELDTPTSSVLDGSRCGEKGHHGIGLWLGHDPAVELSCMTAPTCAIVVPAYHQLTESEWLSIDCLKAVLPGFSTFLLKPRGLELSIAGFSDCSMDDGWFVSTKTYGLLMASPAFYEQFTAFDYILIYQLDRLVFRNDLLAWCARGYNLCCSASLSGSQPWVADSFVSFGGLSLRRVSSCLRVLELVQAGDPGLESHTRELLAFGQEDVWWGRRPLIPPFGCCRSRRFLPFRSMATLRPT